MNGYASDEESGEYMCHLLNQWVNEWPSEYVKLWVGEWVRQVPVN